MAIAFAVGMLTGFVLVTFTAVICYRFGQIHAAEDDEA